MAANCREWWSQPLVSKTPPTSRNKVVTWLILAVLQRHWDRRGRWEAANCALAGRAGPGRPRDPTFPRRNWGSRWRGHRPHVQHRHQQPPGRFHLVCSHEKRSVVFHHVPKQGFIGFGRPRAKSLLVAEPHVHRSQAELCPDAWHGNEGQCLRRAGWTSPAGPVANPRPPRAEMPGAARRRTGSRPPTPAGRVACPYEDRMARPASASCQ